VRRTGPAYGLPALAGPKAQDTSARDVTGPSSTARRDAREVRLPFPNDHGAHACIYTPKACKPGGVPTGVGPVVIFKRTRRACRRGGLSAG
jgi:hypothetical protein